MATPAPGDPQPTHEDNALAHYFLECTAFTPGVMMNSARKEPQTYEIIAANAATASSQLYLNDRIKLPPQYLDFDRLAILFQYGDMCYTITKETPKHPSTEGIQRYWISKRHLVPQLTIEWDSLPHLPVGKIGLGALCDPESSTWHVRSKIIMALRASIASTTTEIERARWRARNTPSERQFLAALDQEFNRVVTAVYGTLRVQEDKRGAEVMEACEEFTDHEGWAGRDDCAVL
jgi:hypothetical protein